ncbi:hypothetical protein N9L68_01785 [bacterium]|nr:hypothetical protein [bacterium]
MAGGLVEDWDIVGEVATPDEPVLEDACEKGNEASDGAGEGSPDRFVGYMFDAQWPDLLGGADDLVDVGGLAPFREEGGAFREEGGE